MNTTLNIGYVVGKNTRVTAGGMTLLSVVIGTAHRGVNPNQPDLISRSYARVKFLGKRAEYIDEIVHEGDAVAIEGRISSKVVERGRDATGKAIREYYEEIQGVDVVVLREDYDSVYDDNGQRLMLEGTNLVRFDGNLGADPDIRVTPSGAQVGNMPVYIRSYQNGEARSDAIQMTGWEGLADVMKTLKKGDPVYGEGSFITQSYMRDGQRVYVNKISLTQLHPAARRNRGAAATTATQAAPARAAVPVSVGMNEFPPDEDLPF